MPSEGELLKKIQNQLGVSRSSCKLLKFNVEDILALPQIQQGKFTKNVHLTNPRKAVDEII